MVELYISTTCGIDVNTNLKISVGHFYYNLIIGILVRFYCHLFIVGIEIYCATEGCKETCCESVFTIRNADILEYLTRNCTTTPKLKMTTISPNNRTIAFSCGANFICRSIGGIGPTRCTLIKFSIQYESLIVVFLTIHSEEHTTSV